VSIFITLLQHISLELKNSFLQILFKSLIIRMLRLKLLSRIKVAT